MTNEDLFRVLATGIGATAVLDIWLFALQRAGVQTLPMSLIGRWIGYVAQGRPLQPAIRQARPIAGESALGWLFHYGVGVVFAAILVSLAGSDWIRSPTLLPAVALGIFTVAMPLLVMQPAMGAGFAASRTPKPILNCLKSVANHAVFGCGLYLSAAAVSQFIT